MQKKIVIDTNIYIDIFNHGLHGHLHNSFQNIVFLAHPVLHELWMGAKGKRELKHLLAFQDRFVRQKRMIMPSAGTLVFTGQVCQMLRSTGNLDPSHPKHYNDITIAMMARQIGATVITKNIRNFEKIIEVVDFSFEAPGL